MKVLKNHTKKKQFFLQFFNPLPTTAEPAAGRGRLPATPAAEAAPTAQPHAVSDKALSSMAQIQPNMKGPLSNMVPLTAEGVTPKDPKSAANNEMEYYTHQKKSVAWFDADMCVHCIGQLGVGQRHKDMQDVYYVVLPICQHPRQMGGSTSYVSSSQTASRCSRILTRSWPGKP
eukprot:jgi/Tetstr1/448546/TSEL_035804.t1